MKDKKPEKDLDKILQEALDNAPTIEGFTIAQLAEIKGTPIGHICPTCGRPYGNGRVRH